MANTDRFQSIKSPFNSQQNLWCLILSTMWFSVIFNMHIWPWNVQKQVKPRFFSFSLSKLIMKNVMKIKFRYNIWNFKTFCHCFKLYFNKSVHICSVKAQQDFNQHPSPSSLSQVGPFKKYFHFFRVCLQEYSNNS